MTEDALDAIKARVSREYLGRGCIHGVGIDREQQAVRIYIDSGSALEPSTIDEIKRAAHPFAVAIIEEGRSKFAKK
jgi:hypothetical protein